MAGYSILLKEKGQSIHEYDLRLAELPDGRLIFVGAQALFGYWDQAQPVLDKIIASIVVGPPPPTATPTTTPTATPLTSLTTPTLVFGKKP